MATQSRFRAKSSAKQTFWLIQQDNRIIDVWYGAIEEYLSNSSWREELVPTPVYLPEIKPLYFVYKLTNQVNGKAYIGYTGNLWQRFNAHRTKGAYRNAEKEALAVQLAIQKHGWQAFSKEVLYCTRDLDHVVEMETHFITAHGTLEELGHGYNLSLGGPGNGTGRRVSPITREKMSQVRRREENTFFGKRHTLEARQRMSAAARQRPSRFGEYAPGYGRTRSQSERDSIADKLSESWLIVYPDAQQDVIKNLRAFCRAHNLNYSLLLLVASGRQRTHKGYKAYQMVEGEPFIPVCEVSGRVYRRGYKLTLEHRTKLSKARVGVPKSARSNERRSLAMGESYRGVLESKEIVEFRSLTRYARENGFSRGPLQALVRGKVKSSYGFIKLEKIGSRPGSARKKPTE